MSDRNQFDILTLITAVNGVCDSARSVLTSATRSRASGRTLTLECKHCRLFWDASRWSVSECVFVWSVIGSCCSLNIKNTFVTSRPQMNRCFGCDLFDQTQFDSLLSLIFEDIKRQTFFFLCIYIIMTYFLLLWPTWGKRLIPIRGYVKYFSRQWWMVRLWPISSFMLPSLTPNFNPNFARQIVRFRNVWMICGPQIWSPKWGSKMALTVLLLGHIYYFLLLDKMISCSWCLWPRFWVGASVKWKPFCQCVWLTMHRWMLELLDKQCIMGMR